MNGPTRITIKRKRRKTLARRSLLSAVLMSVYLSIGGGPFRSGKRITIRTSHVLAFSPVASSTLPFLAVCGALRCGRHAPPVSERKAALSSQHCHCSAFSPISRLPTIATAFTGRLDSTIRPGWRLFATSSPSASPSPTDETVLSEIKRRFKTAVELYQTNMKAVPPNLGTVLKDLETEAADPSFWDADHKDRNAAVTAQISRYSRLKARVQEWTSLRDDGQAALEMLLEGADDEALFSPAERQSLVEELGQAAARLLEEGERYQLESLLSGPYDEQSCRILLTAGAGGTEACDWVADLKRMYERHAQKMGYSVTIEDEQQGDVVGYKSVEMIVTAASSSEGAAGVSGGGNHPYGWFRGEKGAHRLVRLSPFNANNKRQTTFAGVDVAPILDEDDLRDIEIPDKDLEITAMRSGGAGGQNVNKVSSAVRIKHLPSGLSVKCTQERSQAVNKDLALKRLKAQLLAIAKEQRVAEIQEIRGDQVEASWGAQIRNYVLHPYKMIKDQRTNWETSNVQSFLDGDLEDCIGELLKSRAREEQEASLQL